MDRARTRQIVIERRPDQPPSEEAVITQSDPRAEPRLFEALLTDAEEFDWEQVITF